MNTSGRILLCLLACAVVAATGCREHYPHSFTIAPGDVERMHAKPAEGGYYTNWDPYAAELKVEPMVDTNPVATQHVLIATVLDKEGKPLPNRRVEWILPEGGVGTLVEVDESGWRSSRGHKLTNRYAVTHTNNFDHVLTRGNDDPSDDIHLKKGQTWAVITSAVEGTSNVIVYAPGIYDWGKHKVFVTKNWADAVAVMPAQATNPTGAPHKLTTKVTKASDGAPLEGYHVIYRIVSGPAAKFTPGDGQTAVAKTDAQGMASATLNQVQPAEGVNEIEVRVIRPESKDGGWPKPQMLIATGRTTKTWIGPKIAIAKSAPTSALVGETFAYAIAVSNSSQVAAKNVKLTDTLPDGISLVSSEPKAAADGQSLSWSLGEIGPRGSKAIRVTVKAGKTGRFTNCASVTADQGLSARDCADTVVNAPKLALKKTGPAEGMICDTFPYTLTVTNAGDAAARNVKIVEKMPAGMTTAAGDKSATFDIGTLPAGESKSVRYTAKVSKGGTYTNEATATADGGLKSEDSHKLVVREPKLTLAKSAPQQRFLGQTITYELTVTNAGDTDATNAMLVDTLPADSQFVQASGDGKYADGKVTWSLGAIAAGKSTKVAMTVKPTKIGTFANSAKVTAKCTEDTATATTEVKGIPAILLECVDTEDPIEVGSEESYVIKVTNQGTADDTNVVIRCEIPAEMEYVSSKGPTKAAAKDKEVTFAPLDKLPAGKAVTYTVVTKGVKASHVRFKVILTSDQFTKPIEETESTNVYDE